MLSSRILLTDGCQHCIRSEDWIRWDGLRQIRLDFSSKSNLIQSTQDQPSLAYSGVIWLRAAVDMNALVSLSYISLPLPAWRIEQWGHADSLVGFGAACRYGRDGALIAHHTELHVGTGAAGKPW